MFKEGRSTVAALGRNDHIINFGLSVVRCPVDKTLMLGCRPYELWTTAGQPKIASEDTEIVGIDINPQITEINRGIKKTGRVSMSEVAKHAKSSAINNAWIRDVSKGLDAIGITGVSASKDQLTISEKNRSRVTVLPAQDARTFVLEEEPGSYTFIFSGNLENNILFQKGFNWIANAEFHKRVTGLLREKGVYAFTTNDVFFHTLRENDPWNVMQTIDSAGLEVIFKATMYSEVLDNSIIGENCGLVTARKGDYEALPNAEKVVGSVRKRFSEYVPDIEVLEAEGALEDFKSSIKDRQTNIVLVKTGPDRYHWFNMKGSYPEVFSRLAQHNSGFYPELFTAIA